MADRDLRPDEPVPPTVSAERVGTEAVLLRFNLTDGALDLAADDEEPMGGDAACWAHLFDDLSERNPEGNDR